MINNHKENQLRYMQQHLDNERTYLAWIRTAVAILGIGFFATILHLLVGNDSPASNLLAFGLTLSTGCGGIITIILGTISYFRWKKQIRK